MTRKWLVRSCLALATLGVSPFSHATLTLYNSAGSFNTAVTGAVTDNFDDLPSLPPAGIAQPLNRLPGGGYTATLSSGPGGLFVPFDGDPGAAIDIWLGANLNTDSIIFDTFSATVQAIGGFFFNTAFSGAVQSGRSVTVTAYDDLGDIESFVVNSGTATTFTGFTSDGKITKLTVAPDNAGLTSGIGTWATVNDLVLAGVADNNPPPNRTPEPGTLALLGLAALGLGVSAKRRRQQ